jgi:hypothetical protein
MNLIERTAIYFAAAIFLFALQAPGARAQESQASPPPQPPPSQQQHSHADMPGLPGMPAGGNAAGENPDAAKSATDAMSHDHMDMGPHMYMTMLQIENPADDKRAAALVVTLREAIAKYKDYKVALADGFEILHPEVPQEHYHFTNYRYGLEAAFAFSPSHPTSLLYKKTAEGYELEGAMYTARKTASEDDLNARVPLSVARWHKHVNICLPPKGAQLQQVNLTEFGFRGSIATEEACNAAGGRWYPQIFGWMVHVYPYETDPAKIWAH